MIVVPHLYQAVLASKSEVLGIVGDGNRLNLEVASEQFVRGDLLNIGN